MTKFSQILKLLEDGKVEFIVIGGVAAGAHGAARATYDVDVVYRRTSENMQHLVDALASHSPYPRGAPSGLPFVWDKRTLEMGLNFTLITDLGDLDLLGEIGGERYDELLSHSEVIPVLGEMCRCLQLQKLIDVKRAAGRPKDFEALAELEALREEMDREEQDQ